MNYQFQIYMDLCQQQIYKRGIRKQSIDFYLYIPIMSWMGVINKTERRTINWRKENQAMTQVVKIHQGNEKNRGQSTARYIIIHI